MARPGRPREAPTQSGIALASAAVLSFSLTLPATRVAVAELPALAVGFGRQVVPGLLGLLYLWWRRSPMPRGREWARLALVASGIGVGFPLCTALALRYVPASHGAVVVGFNPIATAIAAVLLSGERPSLRFWGFSIAGLATVLVYAHTQGASHLQIGDVYLLLAVVSVAISYAQGASLARDMPGFEVVCWGLAMALPLTLPISLLSWSSVHVVSARALLAFGYVSLVSQFLGLWIWYRGLAAMGAARGGQLQLAQPLLTLMWSAWLLHERLTLSTVAAATAVLAAGIATVHGRISVGAGSSDRRGAPGSSIDALDG